MKIKISTDSSCLINNEMLKKYNISVFPLNVIIDNQEYLDGVNINQEFLKNEMKKNKTIKTSTPPIGKVIEYFNDLFKEGYDKIIHFTLSSKLSSMFNLFTQVSNEYFENKLVVIDSYSASALMLTYVLFAYEEVNKGIDVDEIKRIIEEKKKDGYIKFTPENLTALKNGGRISPAIAALGNTLGLKPVLLLKDGELVKDSMTRNIKKSFIDGLNVIYNDYSIEKYDYVLISFGANENTLKHIKEHIEKLFEGYKVVEGIIPMNVCAHCGPGTIGLLITPKINGKSLNEYL